MDFLKSNAFYVILAVAVLVVALPSYFLGNQRVQDIRVGQSQAEKSLRGLDRTVDSIKRVSPEAAAAAEEYNAAFAQDRKDVIKVLKERDRYLDYTFLVEPTTPDGVPPGEAYKLAYYAAYDKLKKSLIDSGLSTDEEKPLKARENWKSKTPPAEAIRITQKKYLILKELVDVLTDVECGVMSVQRIALDSVPNGSNAQNRPDSSGMFWTYPMLLDLQIDLSKFPIFLERLVGNERLFFYPRGNMQITRAFDESQPVYVEKVSVSMYVQVWDYISTDFERQQLDIFRAKEKARTASTARRGGSRGGR